MSLGRFLLGCAVGVLTLAALEATLDSEDGVEFVTGAVVTGALGATTVKLLKNDSGQKTLSYDEA